MTNPFESLSCMLEPVTKKLFSSNQPSSKSLGRGFGPTLEDSAWRSRRLVSLVGPVSSINDTLCEIFSAKRHYAEPDDLEDGRRVLRQKMCYEAKPIADITCGELIRARELRQIKDTHYAKIADMLLED